MCFLKLCIEKISPPRIPVELGLGLEGGVGFLLMEGREEGRTEKEHRADWVGIFEAGLLIVHL